MNPLLAPGSTAELLEIVRSTKNLVAVGYGTKPRLCAVDDRYRRVSMVQVRGIVEYEPDEFTITALAGTPLSEIATTLAAQGQYLPFDPLFRETGATLGGAIAASASGPGRFRFGGARDFVLGVRFIDGCGRHLRMGGKVVKNAAGFDLPKFFVGSLGRFGVFTEITLKVLPRPAATRTMQLHAADVAAAIEIMTQAGNSRWQPDAIDIPPAQSWPPALAQRFGQAASGTLLCLRLAGLAPALAEISRDILTRWPGEVLSNEEADRLWSDLAHIRWAHPQGILAKIPLTLPQVGAWIGFCRRLPEARAHVSAGGNVGYVSLASADTLPEFEKQLESLGLTGLTWNGRAPLWLGPRRTTQISQAVKSALDPQDRFPSLDH